MRRPATSCCGWPPRSTRSRRTCWPPRSSRAAASARSRARVPRATSRGARRGHRGEGRRARACASARSRWIIARRRSRRGPATLRRRSALDGSTCVFVAVDGRVAGALLLDDPIRPDTPRVIRTLRRARHQAGRHGHGRPRRRRRVRRRRASAWTACSPSATRPTRSTRSRPSGESASRSWSATASTTRRHSPRPTSASRWAREGRRRPRRPPTSCSTVDRLDRLAEAIAIARRSRRIAVQSVLLGMGLSFGAMLFGAFGLLSAGAGAMVQEVIDVAVILNALRALTPDDREPPEPRSRARTLGDGSAPSTRSSCRAAADPRDGRPARGLTPPSARARSSSRSGGSCRCVSYNTSRRRRPPFTRWWPSSSGARTPMGTMARAHMEIEHLTRVFGHLLTDSAARRARARRISSTCRRVLYGLHAVPCDCTSRRRRRPTRGSPTSTVHGEVTVGPRSSSGSRDRSHTRNDAPPPPRSSTQARPPWSSANRATSDEPDPDARECGRARALAERLEDRVAELRRDARAVVLDDEQHALGRARADATHTCAPAGVWRTVFASRFSTMRSTFAGVDRSETGSASTETSRPATQRLGPDEPARPARRRRPAPASAPRCRGPAGPGRAGRRAAGRACGRCARCAGRSRARRSAVELVVRSSVSANPRIAASGVRSSWDTACRNVFFISSSARSASRPRARAPARARAPRPACVR